jgi:zinc/manganese transport system substrate-binding protein
MLMRRLTSPAMMLVSLLAATLVPIGGNALAQGAAQPLRVAATVPELGSLVREISGDQVTVTVFAKGTEDAHFVEAKPSFIKTLSEADLFLQMGLELEMGWAPVLQQNARNAKVLPGARGFVDASAAIVPLDVPTGQVDRSQGDVHPAGNPHYLLDPVNGLKVARLIRDRLIELRPDKRHAFEQRYDAFRQRLGVALVGEALAQKYDPEKLATLDDAGKLADFLKVQGDADQLGGWLGVLRPYRGAKVVADHNLWPYFARRFGLAVVAFLEPKPGLPPTTKHLNEVIELMRAQRIRVVLANPYFDPRAAQLVAQQTGVRIVKMAHQVGARPGTDDYLQMVDYNVRQLAAALRGDA